MTAHMKTALRQGNAVAPLIRPLWGCLQAWSERTWRWITAHRTPITPPAIRFEDLVGGAAWSRLEPAVRARFASDAATAHHAVYEGSMTHVEASWAGWLLAQSLRLFGTPLAPHVGHRVPARVRLYPDSKRGGVVWERTYHFPGKAPLAVRSVKRPGPDGGLIECVGGGIGMKLRIFEADGALHFASRAYFWQGLGLRIPIPLMLTPGVVEVVHRDIDGRCFRFTMTFRHSWLGRTFYQDGIFAKEGETP